MLYQQGTQKIEIVVRKEGGSALAGTEPKDTESVSTSSEQHEDGKYSALFGTSSPTRKRRILVTNATHAIATARQVSLLRINYHLTGIGFKNGDQAYQDRVQRGLEIAKDVTGTASAITMGGVFGAWGGPVGVIVGMSLGAISSITSTMTKYDYREREYGIKMFKENNEIQYNRARANISLTNGRLR